MVIITMFHITQTLEPLLIKGALLFSPGKVGGIQSYEFLSVFADGVGLPSKALRKLEETLEFSITECILSSLSL